MTWLSKRTWQLALGLLSMAVVAWALFAHVQNVLLATDSTMQVWDAFWQTVGILTPLKYVFLLACALHAKNRQAAGRGFGIALAIVFLLDLMMIPSVNLRPNPFATADMLWHINQLFSVVLVLVIFFVTAKVVEDKKHSV